MKGNTHIAAGAAAALLVTMPASRSACFAALIGGAVGGALPDIDTLDHDRGHDALIAQLIPIGLTALLLAADALTGSGLCQRIFGRGLSLLVPGALVYAALWLIGFRSAHRTFTHSILAVLLFTGAVTLISDRLALPFAAGMLSHILLDLTNKKKARIFYPLRFSWCLGLCRSDGIADRLTLWACVFLACGISANILFFSALP